MITTTLGEAFHLFKTAKEKGLSSPYPNPMTKNRISSLSKYALTAIVEKPAWVLLLPRKMALALRMLSRMDGSDP